MNVERAICECGDQLIRVSAHNHDKKIPVGYYCPSCQALQDTKREYLVPMGLITRMDPFFLRVSKRESYLAVLKTGELPIIPAVTTDKMIDNASDAIGSALKPFCRPAGKHEPNRLNREKFVDDMHNDFIKNVLSEKKK